MPNAKFALPTALQNIQADAASEIRGLHACNIEAAKSSLDRAIRIGELLADVKASLSHGQWLPWCTANLDFSDRTARNYIRVFEKREQLKLESVSDLGVAYSILSEPAPTRLQELEETIERHLPEMRKNKDLWNAYRDHFKELFDKEIFAIMDELVHQQPEGAAE